MELWAKIFGKDFPTPSTDSKALEGALRKGTITASGGGIHAGTRPESRPVIPGRSWSRS